MVKKNTIQSSNDYQFIIIGAGVIGLAIANLLERLNFESVLVIEKENKFGLGISSRNSEVIHSGLYYQKNSLKSKLCINGNSLLYKYCKENSIWHKKTGKIIVCNNNQKEELKRLQKNGIDNGVSNIRFLNNKDLKYLEPSVKGDCGILIKSTGIISAHELMNNFYKNSSNSHDYLFKTFLKNAKRIDNGYSLTIENADGYLENVSCDWVINCGGLNSDIISNYILKNNNSPQIYFSKGSYFKLSHKWRNHFKHLIYPLPDSINKTLGIHMSFDKDGVTKLGPDAKNIPKNGEDYNVDDSSVDLFFAEASKYIKDLNIKDLSPDYSGIRPKIKSKNDSLSDFYIRDEVYNGLPKWINLIGIESPGLTSCLSIANYVLSIIKKNM